MFKGLVVFLLTLTILLFPIPIKITLNYSNNILGIFVYKKKLKLKFSSKKDLKAKTAKINSLKSYKTIKSIFKSYTFSDIKQIIYKISNSKFKPTLKINTKLEYGFDDAALVAILYGLIHSFYSFLYLLLLNFFRVKDIGIKVTPHYKENNINLEISSIIYINLTKIIYMAYVIISSLISIKINHKKINLQKQKGGNIYG